jgi:membrane-associated phospholipid phosphatase
MVRRNERRPVDAILRWGVDVVLWMQQASPSMDGFFKALTFLGGEQFYLLLLPFVYWCVDRVLGIRLIVLLLASALVNTVVKVVAAQPRPFTFDSRVKAITSETTYGFPSGHTQNTTAVWGLLARRARRWWFWTAAGMLLVGVGVSRVYLGVHFPTDVFGGFVIGVLVLWLFERFWPRVERGFTGLDVRVQVLITALGPLVFLLFDRTDAVATGVGTMVGVGVGLVMERRWVHFDTRGTPGRRVARFAAGGLVLLGLWAGLRAVFAGVEPAVLLRVVRYGLVGLWATLGAPWLFVRLRLSDQKPA